MKKIKVAVSYILSISLLSLSSCQPTGIQVPDNSKIQQKNQQLPFYTKKDINKIYELKQHELGNRLEDFKLKTSGAIIENISVSPLNFNPARDLTTKVNLSTNSIVVVTMPGVRWHEIISPTDEYSGGVYDAYFDWDGRNDLGQLVSSGDYSFKFTEYTSTTNGSYNPYCGSQYIPFAVYDEETNSMIPTCSEDGAVTTTNVKVIDSTTPSPTPEPTLPPPSFPDDTIGVRTNSIKFDESNSNLILSGYIVGADDSFDKNTIQAQYNEYITINEQEVTSFNKISDQISEFKLTISDYSIKMPQKPDTVENFAVQATFHIDNKKETVLISDNSFTKKDFSVAAKKNYDIHVVETVKCGAVLSCKSDKSQEILLNKMNQFGNNLESIFQRYIYPNNAPYTERIGEFNVTVPAENPITKNLKFLAHQSIDKSSQNFKIQNVAVANGFVQITGGLGVASLMIDLGLAVGSITPVIAAGVITGVVIKVSIDHFNDIAERAEIARSTRTLIDNLGAPPSDLDNWIPQAHHIIMQAGIRHRGLRDLINRCSQQFPGGVHSTGNGVWMSNWGHGTQKGSSNIHTKNYVNYVINIIQSLFNENGCTGMLSGLNRLRRELKEYDKKIKELVKSQNNKIPKKDIQKIKNETPWEKFGS